MYLRKLDDYNNYSSINQQHLKLLRIILFTLVLIFAIMFSSLTEGESSPYMLLDSLNHSGTVYFDFGKIDIKEESFRLLDRLASELRTNPSVNVEITGHTDNIGSEDFNDELSLKRAEMVQQFLIQKGVKAEQIIISGEGYKNPVTDNNDDNHRALNRRVEFKWVSKQISKEIKKKESDETYVNTGSWKIKENELLGQLSVRDSAGEPITDIQESDVSAVLKWQQNGADDSSDGSVKLIPIDDKKKIAFTFTMDYSGSMFDDSTSQFPKKSVEVIQMEKAVLTFIENMNPNFYGRIIKFGIEIRELVRFTKSKNALRDAVTNYTENLFGTALYKSIWFALGDTTFNSNPTIIKTVIAFTDGEENASLKITKENIYQLSEQNGVKVYTVGLLDDSKHSYPAGMKKTGEADLVDIAKRTGGFYYWARDPNVLPVIYRQIYDQIMKSYNISIIWNGTNLPPKGTPVTAVVKVNVKGMVRILYKNYVMD